jgi:hypothetical protein
MFPLLIALDNKHIQNVFKQHIYCTPWNKELKLAKLDDYLKV